MSEDKKKCFVIMPISDTDGYDNGHFTTVYNHLIKPAVIKAGFESIYISSNICSISCFIFFVTYTKSPIN